LFGISPGFIGLLLGYLIRIALRAAPSGSGSIRTFALMETSIETGTTSSLQAFLALTLAGQSVADPLLTYGLRIKGHHAACGARQRR
jgi:hypothetical protein